MTGQRPRTSLRLFGVAPVALLAVVGLVSGEEMPDMVIRSPADATHAPATEPSVAAEQPAPPPPMAKVTGARQMLEIYGIDASHFRRLTDREPWQEAENEMLLSVIYRLRQFRLMDIERWSRGELSPLELAKDPEAGRGEVFHVSGRVTAVEKIDADPAVRERFELVQYYRCQFLVGPERQPAVVFAERVPQAWKVGQPINEPASAYAVFLKLASVDAAHPTPALVALRVAWHPPTLLGRLGMDVGLFDDIPPEPWSPGVRPPGAKKPRIDPRQLQLGQRDRECFYQMLAAVGRAPRGQLLADARAELKGSGRQQSSVVPLFNRPAEQRAKLFLLSGWVRRAELVRVEDEDIRSRFRLDHYYNLYLFTDDSQDNPLVLCVRELPKGMPLSEAPNYVEDVTAAAFFYKTWAYRSNVSEESESPTTSWQLAPLLIGRDVVWVPRQPPGQNLWTTVALTSVIALGFAGAILLIWRLNRSDRILRETLAKSGEPGGGPSFDQIDLKAEGQPRKDVHDEACED